MADFLPITTTLINNLKVEIREALRDDFEPDSRFDEFYQWHISAGKHMRREYNLANRESFKKHFRQRIKEKENIILGAFHKEKIIGIAQLSFDLDNNKIKHVGSWGVVIHPDFQNKGLGKSFIQTIEKIALNMGIKKLESSVYEPNSPAKHLYIDKLGYIVEGVKKCAAFIDNQYVNEILIAKFLK